MEDSIWQDQETNSTGLLTFDACCAYCIALGNCYRFYVSPDDGCFVYNTPTQGPPEQLAPGSGTSTGTGASGDLLVRCRQQLV